MPHKHTRKGVIDKATVDLPPNEIAKPLAVSKSAASNGIFTTELNPKRADKKRKRKPDAADDTPKAFQRLMAFHQGQKLPKGLDDGVRTSKSARKKQKLEKKAEEGGKKAAVVKAPAAPTHEIPTIRPGEKMGDFAARVDAALPVSGLINKSAKGGKDPLGLKVGRTKTERRMHRMYAEWREEEKRIQERKMDAAEAREEDEMEEDEDGQVKWKAELDEAGTAASKKKKGKGKKKKLLGEIDDGDADPWAKLKKDRAETKIGLNDVALAPPTFTKPPREKFKVRGAHVDVGDVPKASGSLRRREELGDVRRSVVESYRALMKANREKSKED